MDPSTPDADEPIDAMLRDAAPRAPRGFAAAVEQRIEQRSVQWRHSLRRRLGAGALAALAAALLLWLLQPPRVTPHLTPSGWTVVAQTGLTMTAPDGRTAAEPDVGVRLEVAHGGAATLERPLARITLTEDSNVRVADGGALKLSTGGARLEGPEARIDGDVATVAALGVNADIAVRLERRTNMTPGTKSTLATLATVLTVAAHGGGALVQAREHGPVLLAQNDRALVMGGLPPLVTRTPLLLAKNDLSDAKTPTTKPAAKTAPPKAATKAPDPASRALAPATETPSDGLDRDTIRGVVRTSLPDLKSCYEAALSSKPDLGGHVRVKMTIITRDGKGVVDEAEVMPMGEGDLVAPRFEQCVVGVVAKLQFPAFQSDDGKLIVEYPFVFKAGDDE